MHDDGSRLARRPLRPASRRPLLDSSSLDGDVMARTWKEPPGEWIDDEEILDHLDLASIDSLVDRYGLRTAETMIADRLLARAKGRPVVLIDHMQEQPQHRWPGDR
jgi:hypothetical protein